MIDAARRLALLLEASPYAARLGLRTGEVMTDAVTASVPYLPVLANAQGFVHGGVAASLSVWSAMIVAVASDRDHAASVRPVSLSVSYLAAAREEALHATARVASRGRDLVHVEVEIASDRGRVVALALAVLRTLRDAPRDSRRAATALHSGVAAGLAAGDAAGLVDNIAPGLATGDAAGVVEGRRLISPFSQSMGIQLRRHDAASVTIAMRRDLNEGLGGAVDPGALVSLADTCAALACLPSLDERRSGSATLSLSAVFGDPLFAPVLATGRPVAEDGGVRSALVEVGADGERRTPPRAAMTACVAYRFLAAEVPT